MSGQIEQSEATDPVTVQGRMNFGTAWRPFIGWACGVALCWQVLFAPMITFAINIAGYHPLIAVTDSSWIAAVLMPILGLGAMRSYDKKNGVGDSH